MDALYQPAKLLCSLSHHQVDTYNNSSRQHSQPTIGSEAVTEGKGKEKEADMDMLTTLPNEVLHHIFKDVGVVDLAR